jgi:hypothetical protein
MLGKACALVLRLVETFKNKVVVVFVAHHDPVRERRSQRRATFRGWWNWGCCLRSVSSPCTLKAEDTHDACGKYLPAWLAQFVRRDRSGPPRFRASPSARATLLDPGKLSRPSPVAGLSVLGSDKQTPSPLAARTFEAELLKQEAGPACGSRVSLGTLLDGRSTR